MSAMTDSRSHSERAPTGESVPGQLLVVDDDPLIRKLVAAVLSSMGHRVDAASGVDEAIDCLALKGYDVVVIDLQMPHRNGIELLDRVVSDGSDTVPILLTGTRDIQIAISSMKRGAMDYIAKPVDPDDLCRLIAQGVAVAHSRRRERSLKRIAAEWESTFNACPDLLVVFDGNGCILRANRAVHERLKVDGETLVGRSVQDVFPQALGTAIAECRSRLLAGESAAEINLHDPTLRGYFRVSVNALPATPGMAAGIVAVARNLTDQVYAEESRKRLIRQVISAQEDERRRIAKELHDGVGQSLYSLAVGLGTIAQESTTEEFRFRLNRLESIASETMEEVRRLTQGLRPSILDDLGLLAAVSRLTETFTKVHGIRAELVVTGNPIARLQTEVESTVYRIIQEALNNVAKHSRAKTVDLIVELSDRSMRLSIADDGIGFEPSAHPFSGSGCGLWDMNERSLMLGGTFQIVSEPSRGTTIDVCIPIGEVQK